VNASLLALAWWEGTDECKIDVSVELYVVIVIVTCVTFVVRMCGHNLEFCWF
jgi:hypothetical protein